MSMIDTIVRELEQIPELMQLSVLDFIRSLGSGIDAGALRLEPNAPYTNLVVLMLAFEWYIVKNVYRLYNTISFIDRLKIV
jgi:hypothetical protein